MDPAHSSRRTESPTAASGLLLLADIGGYTAFLRSVQGAHRDDAFAGGAVPPAYSLVSSLLDAIIEAIIPPFTLAKLEGDAVFAWTEEGDHLPRGTAVLECLVACYVAFRRRLAGAHDVWTCRCDACARVDTLDLKFVLHAGSFVIQPIAGNTELIGSDVVMAHRLLKTGAGALVGHGAYALVTDEAIRRYDVPTEGSIAFAETYEHYEPIHMRVFSLPGATPGSV
jgi:hypothetical protein